MRVLILALCIGLAGCSTAGPFITNISSDGKGGIVIEKAKARFNSFLGVIDTTETTNYSIQLQEEKK